MMQGDHFRKACSDTAPEKLADMPDETLDAFHRFFVDRHPHLSGRVQESERLAAEGRIGLLRNEIQRRRIEGTSERHHDELMGQSHKTFAVGKDTLRWTKRAAWAAIAGVVVGAIALVYQIHPSRNRRVLTAKPSPTSSPQMIATRSVLSVPATATSTSIPSPLPTVRKESSAPP